MQRLSGTLTSILSSARHRIPGQSANDRRQVFLQEFGQFPAHFEATAAERRQFASEVVEPALVLRAQAIERVARPGATGNAPAPGGDDRADREAAFRRAYDAAVALRLAEGGRAYTDYLEVGDRTHQTPEGPGR